MNKSNIFSAIEKLKTDSKISGIVAKKIKNFSENRNLIEPEFFSELCFCILTANSKAKTALSIQEELGGGGFCNYDEKNIRLCIRKHGHRFHNMKASYIVRARNHEKIKEKVINLINEKGEREARNWLVKNVKGLGYKEASHFLRNIGAKELAIVDRHIINLLVDYKVIREKPKVISKNIYLDIENKLKNIAKKTKLNMAELDLYLWYMKTGEILK